MGVRRYAGIRRRAAYASERSRGFVAAVVAVSSVDEAPTVLRVASPGVDWRNRAGSYIEKVDRLEECESEDGGSSRNVLTQGLSRNSLSRHFLSA